MCLRMEFSANGGVRHFELFAIILKSRSLAIRASRPAMFVNPASLLAFLPMPANAGVWHLHFVHEAMSVVHASVVCNLLPMMEFDLSLTVFFRIRSLTTRSLRQCLSHIRLWFHMFASFDVQTVGQNSHEELVLSHGCICPRSYRLREWAEAMRDRRVLLLLFLFAAIFTRRIIASLLSLIACWRSLRMTCFDTNGVSYSCWLAGARSSFANASNCLSCKANWELPCGEISVLCVGIPSLHGCVVWSFEVTAKWITVDPNFRYGCIAATGRDRCAFY